MRYFLDISFDGTGFSGWQIQPGMPSIQASIESALSQILRSGIAVTGAGRTDAGVHARQMIAHFDTKLDLLDERFLHALNAVLDPRIAINRVIPVRPDAHSRFSATSRTYQYWISRRKDPFLRGRAYRYSGKLDIPAMEACCPILMKTTNFQSFSKVHTDVNSFDCLVSHVHWLVAPEILIFEITANRFLRNMVRAIVGTLLEVGKKRLDLDGFQEVINSLDRSRAGWSVPAQGLYLWQVSYPEHLLNLT